jgi:hypothetical protein
VWVWVVVKVNMRGVVRVVRVVVRVVRVVVRVVVI